MSRNNGTDGDFDPKTYSDRIGGLEEFKKEYEGVNFYQKVCDSIKKSKDVENEIKGVVWDVIKAKILYVILTVLVVIFFDVLKELASSLISKV